MIKHNPNKITATLKVVVTGEFYDDEASEETLRYCVEQDLEDAGFEVDVSMLKEQEAVKPKLVGPSMWRCGKCNALLGWEEYTPTWPELVEYKFCQECGKKVKWK